MQPQAKCHAGVMFFVIYLFYFLL